MPQPDLPDFTRVSWASQEARERWETVFSRVGAAFQEIELLTVAEGVRRAARTTVSAENLPAWSAKVRDLGLVPVPLRAVAASSSYSNAASDPDGGPVSFLVGAVQGPNDTAGSLYRAAHGSEEGELLGYPECCRVFFDEVWEQDRDTTWAMARPGARNRRPRYKPDEPRGEVVDIREFYRASILLRWFGVRLVPHLPCAFDCDPSHRLAEKFEAVGRKHGFGDEMDLALEMLSWPVRYSVLHGIAEIVTPVVKAVSRSTWTHEKKTVNYHGKGYPVAGASGVRFPFRPGGRPAAKLVPAPSAAHWELNGFSSAQGMREAHEVIVEASRAANLEGVTLVDLGCGNGELLRQLREAHPGGEIVGVDTNGKALEDALLRSSSGRWLKGDIFNANLELPDDAVILLMPGRFIEAGVSSSLERHEDIDRLKASLEGRAVLVYAYGDWLETGLRGLCEAVELDGAWHSLHKGPGVEAALVSEVVVGPTLTKKEATA